jgi:hypothetical protein
MTKRPKVIKETPVIEESQPQNGETRQYIENSGPPQPQTPSSSIQHVQLTAPPPTPAAVTPPVAAPPVSAPAAPKKLTAAEKRKEAAKKKQQQERVKKMQEARKKKQAEKEAELERKLEEKILARLNQSKKRPVSALRPAAPKQVHFEPKNDSPPPIDRSSTAVGRKRDRYQDENQYESSDNEDSKSKDYYSEDEDEEETAEDIDDDVDDDDGPVDPRQVYRSSMRRPEDPRREYRQRFENIRTQITQGRRNVYF